MQKYATYIRVVPEKDIHITNRDGSLYCCLPKGVPIWVWDGRRDADKLWRRFRRMVFDRDDYTCQLCGSKDKASLRVHHKKPVKNLPNQYYEISNTLTLCDECHRHIPRGARGKRVVE
jgi:5-methylcytosine-specific restriction endonuclease McrA